MLKDFQVDLELSPKDNRVIQTGATYWSHDVNTAKINIKLLRHSEPVVLNKDVTVRVMMLFDDENKSEHIYTAKIEDEKAGIVSVILDKNVRSYVGQVICGVYADYGAEQKTDNGYFTFAMKRSLIDKRMPEMKQYYVSDFEDTLAKMKLTNAEFAEVETKLNGRIDKIEKDIASNEVVKETDFNQLKTKFNNLSIGTRNYLLDSYINVTTSDYVIKKINLVEHDFSEGEEFTISIKGKMGDDVTHLQIYNSGGDVNLTAISKGDINKNGVYKKTFNWKKTKTDSYINILKWPQSSSSENTLEWVKLEKGNQTPNDWTSAEEEKASKKDISDLQKQIDDIKKAITNLGGTL